MNAALLIAGAILVVPEKELVSITLTSGTRIGFPWSIIGTIMMIAGLVLS